MVNSHTIHIAGVGPILFEHSKRARRITISIKPLKGVRVAVPARISFKQALEFVNLKKPWIRKHLTRIKQIESKKKALLHSSSIDKASAKKTITARAYHLAEKHGFTLNRVSIRNQKTRWGSCSHKNNISLNMKLVLLPDELADYVILHELVHTRINDHSKRFWDELGKYVVDGKSVAKRLRKYGLELL